jgi:intron-binding protein aquarius
MDQSFFTRFMKLRVPYVQLNVQGKARPSISKLYNWCYCELGDLPNVHQEMAFNLANACFAHEYQLIHILDYEGKGQSEPNPYFY